MLNFVRKMESGIYTQQGLRRTVAVRAVDDTHNYLKRTLELALVHNIKNQAEAAYRRGDQLERRRELLKAWSSYVEVQK